MRAMLFHRYGRQDAARLEEVQMPVMADDQVLVRIRAAAVNPADWRRLTGTPWLLVRGRAGRRAWLRPVERRLGLDYAGVVEAVGRDVTAYRPGDEIYGASTGSFAEYVIARQGGSNARKPAGLSFEEAAAAPVAAVTALQGLRDYGRIQPGQKVLVNGASGGVGTFAVQLAKAFGAEVTGVCSTRNVDLVRSLGADHVIDYTRGDFTRIGRRYDLLLDNMSNRSWAQYRRILAPEGILVFAGGQHTNRLIGPTLHQKLIGFAARRDRRTVVKFRCELIHADMEVLAGLLDSGKVRPVIDRTYRLEETAEALGYLAQEHVPGKLVIIP